MFGGGRRIENPRLGGARSASLSGLIAVETIDVVRKLRGQIPAGKPVGGRSDACVVTPPSQNRVLNRPRFPWFAREKGAAWHFAAPFPRAEAHTA